MFAKKLKEIMAIRDMTAADVARATGLSETTVSAWMKGRSGDPKLSTIEKLASALRISPEYFFEANTLGPGKLLSHLSEEERKFVLDDKYLPWVKLTKQAVDEGIPEEVVEQILNIIKQGKSRKMSE